MPAQFYRGMKPVGMTWVPAIKFMSNGIPMKADPYKSCSNSCTYCFARMLSAGMVERQGVRYDPRVARYMDLGGLVSHLKKVLSGRDGWERWSLRTKKYVEVGTMSEPFQPEDKQMRITWNFLQLMRQYRMPLYINTKGNLLITDDAYRDMVFTHPAPVILNVTLVTTDDKLGRKIETRAPLPSERLALIKSARDAGIPTTVYCAPFMRGYTDYNISEYVGKIVEAGALGIHLRTFYITGKMLNARLWRDYVEEFSDDFDRAGQGYAWSYATLRDAYYEMQGEIDKVGSNMSVVGMKKRWFDLNPWHGKMCYDRLNDFHKEPIFDFTSIPILRKIREKEKVPQVLVWDKLGYRSDGIDYPSSIFLGRGDTTNYLLRGGCSTGHMLGRGWMVPGYDWVRAFLWNGFFDEPEGWIRSVDRIWPIRQNGEWYKENGDFAYAYVPSEYRAELVVDDEFVELSSVEGAFRPERAGGTEDKFWDLEEYDNLRV